MTPPLPAEPDAPASMRKTATERSIAALGYGLVVAALFTVWITGVFAWIMAFQHRNSPDPVARAHFRFQLWIADLAGVAVGIAAAGAVSALILVGAPVWEGGWPTLGEFGGAAGLVVLGLVLWGLAVAGTIAGAAFGAWRLLRGRTVRNRLVPQPRKPPSS